MNKSLEEAVNIFSREGSWQCPISFKLGAEWQQKQSYSKEEVLTLLESFEKLCYSYQGNKDWFPAKKSEWIKENINK